MNYTIKEVSKLLELTEHTIRYYCDLGLVPSLTRDKNNRRIFDIHSITWLAFISHLKNSGMTLDKVKEYIDLWQQGNSTLPERLAILKNQQEITIHQINEAQERLSFLQEKATRYQSLIDHEIDPTSPPVPTTTYSSIKKLLAKNASAKKTP